MSAYRRNIEALKNAAEIVLDLLELLFELGPFLIVPVCVIGYYVSEIV